MTTLVLDILQKFGTEITDLPHTIFLKRQVYFTVLTHLTHISCHLHSRLQCLENFFLIHQTTELIVYNHFVTEVGLLPNHYFHFVTLVVRRYFFGKISLYFGRRHDTITVFIHMCMNHIAMTFLHLHLLFAERDEKILHQSPIQECTIFIHPGHFQTSKLTNLYLRFEGSGNETFLIIQINEHIEHITRLGTFGHITGRQQNLAVVSSIEVDTEIHFLHYFQLVVFS